ILGARAPRPDQGGPEAARTADDRRPGRGVRAALGPGDAPRARRHEAAGAGAERVPAASLPDDPCRARAFAHAAAGPGVGRPRVRGRAHGGCAHPAPEKGARAGGAGPADRDGTRLRVPVLSQPGVSVAAIILGAIAAVLAVRV